MSDHIGRKATYFVFFLLGLRCTQCRHGQVAGLFVLVEALEKTGVTKALADLLQNFVQQSATLAAWVAGVVLAVGCNLVNNLPAGLIAGRVVALARVPDHVRSAVLIGVDLGPNLDRGGMRHHY